MIHSLRDDVIHDSFTFLAVIHDSKFHFHPRVNLMELSASMQDKNVFGSTKVFSDVT